MYHNPLGTETIVCFLCIPANSSTMLHRESMPSEFQSERLIDAE